MTKPGDGHCPFCRGDRWVCEDHSTQPQGHDECDGAGVPCPGCNPYAPLNEQLRARAEAAERELADLREHRKRLVEALTHAVLFYVPSPSAVAEVLSCLNGYNGDGDIMEATGLTEELARAQEKRDGR